MIYILVIIIAVLIYLSNRVNYSRYVCHAINFRTKLIKMSEKDTYWLEVYENLPDIKEMARITKRSGTMSCLTKEQQLQYFKYDLMERK